MKRVVIALGVLLGLSALVVLAYASVRVAERGRFASPYSTYSAGPEGTRALLLLARSLGHEALPFTRELSHLPRGTLVLVAGCKTELLRKVARPEREALGRWVAAGSLLIVAGRPDLLPDEAGLSTLDTLPCAGEKKEPPLSTLFSPAASRGRGQSGAFLNAVDAIASGPPLIHLLPFEVEAPIPLRVAHDAEATELLVSMRGPLALTAPFGRGRVVLLGIPDALTNRAITDGGGLVFARLLRAFAPAGPVLFDEYHLGMGERRTVIGYLRSVGYAPLLVQLVLAVLAYMLAGSARLVPPPSQGPREALQARTFLDALGGLFARTGDRAGALSVLAREAQRRISLRYLARDVPPLARPEARFDSPLTRPGARLDHEHLLIHQLRARGLLAVASYVQRIAEHAERPLEKHETLESRARAIESDETAALVIGETT